MRRFPNAMVVMIAFILFTGLMTFIIPQGEYERTTDAETGQEFVVQGSYERIEGSAPSIFKVFMAVPEGLADTADLIILILLIGGAFYVIEKTGAMKDGLIFMSNLFRGKEGLALIFVSLAFFAGGAMSGLQEEIIAMTPVLLFFSKRLGYNPFTTISISFGAAIMGSAFSPINPFAVVIAQKAADLPYLSGSGFRLIIMILAFILWSVIVLWYANKNRTNKVDTDGKVNPQLGWRTITILSLVVLAFAILIYGMMKLDWGFKEMSAEFFVLGIVAGLIGKLGINGTSMAYISGFKEMIFAALICGFARSISFILIEGQILDTVVYALFTPLEKLPNSLAAVGMMGGQALLHFPVPSYSGQAVLTMPILVPLSDLMGISRQITVLAYQFGAVTMDLLIPTNGALMAILAIAGISYDKWFKFIIKPAIIVLTFGGLSIVAANLLGYS